MSREFEEAQRKWNEEVDRVAVDLLESGTPPMQAIREAVEIVKRRRRKSARVALSASPEDS